MAEKGKQTGKTTVRRIKATDDSPKKTIKKKPTTKPARAIQKTEADSGMRDSFVGYFKGAWTELKLVRWPTRANTWIMTGTVIGFTLLLTTLILLLDAGFNWVFEQILK